LHQPSNEKTNSVKTSVTTECSSLRRLHRMDRLSSTMGMLFRHRLISSTLFV
jgi:hypothetical protein